MSTNDKFTELKKTLNRMKRVIIAYSGGVDSTLLLKAAALSGLENILAVTGSSKSVPSEDLSFARHMTSDLAIRHEIIETNELDDKNYADNPSDRCYYCKKELFSRLKTMAEERKIPYVLDGSNHDDAQDWRPGRKAAQELGVLSPLMEVDLTKKEIREISKELGLPTWDKPAGPCLSSRLPYGQKITSQALEMVAQAEAFIKNFGIKELRVRHHADTARIEVLPDDMPVIMNNHTREKINSFLKGLGYKYVTIDLQGFRSGSLNE